MSIRGLLFDLDGVIVDTAKYHYIAWKEITKELGINFTLDDNERLKGVSRLRSFEIILEIGGITMDPQTHEEYCEKKNKIYLSYINKMGEDEILPGVKEFIIDAKEKGYKIALGSASKNSITILKRLNLMEYFDAIVDGTKVSKAKPNPEVFINGARELGLEFHECLVFEDSVAGIDAAHNCGIKAVGVGPKELLPKSDINIDGFEGISIKILEKELV